MDSFMHYFSLLIPIILLAGGLWGIFVAVTGLPRFYEESKNPRMQEQMAQWGKKKAQVIHFFASLVMLAAGGYLLYCWIFGPRQL